MTFEQASGFPIPFGKHKGRTLEDVAADGDEGYTYLDWLVGQTDLRQPFKAAIECFCLEDSIASEIERVIDERDEKRNR